MDIPKAWIEAGARALCDSGNNAADTWDFESEAMRDLYRATATSCLAAVFGKGKVLETCDSYAGDVVYVNDRAEVLHKGDTLIVVRGPSDQSILTNGEKQ